MKTPLGTEVDLGAGHIVLDGIPALRERGTGPADFSSCIVEIVQKTTNLGTLSPF